MEDEQQWNCQDGVATGVIMMLLLILFYFEL
jgi:hypothetical protein